MINKETKKKLKAINLTKRFDKLVKYRISTGNIAFNRVIGGGIPSGRLTEFYGGESTYKSALCGYIITETQKAGGIGVLVDTEKSIEQGLVELTGIDMNDLIYPDPEKIETVEDVTEVITTSCVAIREEFPDVPITIIWDSVAATPGMEDMEKDIGRAEASMRRAKLIGDALRDKIMPLVYKNQICLIFVNQIRDRMNVKFGDKTSTPGGRQIKFLASLRLGMKVIGSIKDKDTEEQVGAKIQLIVRKSKVCRPFGVVNFEMLVDESMSKYAGLLDYLKRHGEIDNKGKEYFFLDNKKTTFLKGEFPEVYEKRLKNVKK